MQEMDFFTEKKPKGAEYQVMGQYFKVIKGNRPLVWRNGEWKSTTVTYDELQRNYILNEKRQTL